MTASPSPAPDDLRGGRSGKTPGVLRAAVALTAAAGGVLVVYGLFLAVEWVSERPDDPVAALLLVVLSLVWGAGLVVCARGLAHGHRWAMAPVVTSALLLLAVGWQLAGGDGAEVAFGWALLVMGAACVVSVLGCGRHLA